MPTCKWRAAFSRRGPLAPPSARPTKLLRPSPHRGLHWIPFNVPSNPAKLVIVPHHPIEILFLPEPLTAPLQYPVGHKSRRSIDPSNKLRDRQNRRAQQVDMIGHNHEGMQSTDPTSVDLSQLLLYDARDLRLPQIDRTKPSRVEQPVARHKGLTGRNVLPPEGSFPRQAVHQAPRDKRRHPRSINVRQAATIASHALSCRPTAIVLKKALGGAEAPRGLKPALQG